MTRLVLLPSALLAPIQLQAEFGAISSAMIPLNGRPAMSYIAEKYLAAGFEVLVAVDQGGEQIRDYLGTNPEAGIRAVGVEGTRSLGETVCRALDTLAALPDLLVINFADTVVGDPLPDHDAIFFAREPNTWRWTTFEIGAGGSVQRIAERNHEKSEGPLPVFVGVFSIGDVAGFRAELAGALATPDDSDVDPFYRALQAYFNRLAPDRRALLPAAEWHDFGHLDTYYETKRKIFSAERFFNRVTVDDDRSILRKESDNTEKFLGEVRWYLSLPKALQDLSPRLFDYSLDPAAPFVEMEFYGYPVLSDVYLHGCWDPGVWLEVFQRLNRVTARMSAVACGPEAGGDPVQAMRHMYEEKTRERLNEVIGAPHLARFVGRRVSVNGVPCPGVAAALELLPGLIADLRLYDMTRFSVIHGDLCLSNILYDPKNRIIRLIDPRGGFGPYGIHGDFRYDLAKLSHSIAGDYDFLVNGLFRLEWTGDDSVVLAPRLRDVHHDIKRIWRSQLRLDPRTALQVSLIESLLFLSMVPLHQDRPASQEAFLARGLLTLAEVARSVRGA